MTVLKISLFLHIIGKFICWSNELIINVNNSSNHNNIDSSLFSSLRYLKTEETNKIKNRKRLRYNNINKNDYHEYQELWNNSNYNVNNRMKYKLCFHNYKKPNISYIKGL